MRDGGTGAGDRARGGSGRVDWRSPARASGGAVRDRRDAAGTAGLSRLADTRTDLHRALRRLGDRFGGAAPEADRGDRRSPPGRSSAAPLWPARARPWPATWPTTTSTPPAGDCPTSAAGTPAIWVRTNWPAPPSSRSPRTPPTPWSPCSSGARSRSARPAGLPGGQHPRRDGRPPFAPLRAVRLGGGPPRRRRQLRSGPSDGVAHRAVFRSLPAHSPSDLSVRLPPPQSQFRSVRGRFRPEPST